MAKQTDKATDVLCVDIFEAKPNKLFSEEQRQLIRFLRYNKPVACAECGKKTKKMWTMLCTFTAKQWGQFALTDSGKAHPPLTAVCEDHPLGIHGEINR
jgi:hypothetical protein